MAHYEGETLAARLARGPLTMAEIARLVAQVADALDAAHAAGIVHRDLKPSNLMLTTTGQVKVLDFGLAKIETGETVTQLTRAGSTMGTAAYMSPEQAAGEAVDSRSDLWSLGVITYEMLAGRLPFQGTNTLAIIQAVLTATLAPIRTLRPDVAPELEEVVSRTLVQERKRRTITASDVRSLAAACHARLSSSGDSLRSRGRECRAARWSWPRSSRSPSEPVASRGGRTATRRYAGRGRRRCPRSSGSRRLRSSTTRTGLRSRRSYTSARIHSLPNR